MGPLTGLARDVTRSTVDVVERLQGEILCGDGAMGTMLLDAGVPLTTCFEELCLTEPALIRGIHEQYVDAGARVIETNSFGANAVRLQRFGLEARVAEINYAAAQLAREVANRRGVFVAGSVGPVGISADEAKTRGIDRRASFRDQISALADGGADLIVLETFTRLEEMMVAFAAAKGASDEHVICSFACNASGLLACGTPVLDAFATLRAAGATMFGLNCISAADALRVIGDRAAEGLVAVYPSAGLPTGAEGTLVYDTEPNAFAATTRTLIDRGVRIVGGCCGTTPEHVRVIAEEIGRRS